MEAQIDQAVKLFMEDLPESERNKPGMEEKVRKVITEHAKMSDKEHKKLEEMSPGEKEFCATAAEVLEPMVAFLRTNAIDLPFRCTYRIGVEPKTFRIPPDTPPGEKQFSYRKAIAMLLASTVGDAVERGMRFTHLEVRVQKGEVGDFLKIFIDAALRHWKLRAEVFQMVSVAEVIDRVTVLFCDDPISGTYDFIGYPPDEVFAEADLKDDVWASGMTKTSPGKHEMVTNIRNKPNFLLANLVNTTAAQCALGTPDNYAIIRRSEKPLAEEQMPEKREPLVAKSTGNDGEFSVQIELGTPTATLAGINLGDGELENALPGKILLVTPSMRRFLEAFPLSIVLLTPARGGVCANGIIFYPKLTQWLTGGST